MKTAAILVCAMMAAALASPPVQDGPCSAAETIKQKFCEKCDRVFEPEKLKVKTDKDGKCKECIYQGRTAEKPTDIELCVKRTYACICGGDPESCCGNCPKTHLRQVNCCGKKTIEQVDKEARAFYRCLTCAGRSWWKDKVTHKDDCKKKDVKRTCTASGKAPHDS